MYVKDILFVTRWLQIGNVTGLESRHLVGINSIWVLLASSLFYQYTT